MIPVTLGSVGSQGQRNAREVYAPRALSFVVTCSIALVSSHFGYQHNFQNFIH
jgi:hypothetical protein